MSLLISIADCNHGFWTPEEEECSRLSKEFEKNIFVQYQNCTQDDIVSKCRKSGIIAVQRLQLTKKIIQAIPSCRVVVRLGVGLDNVDADGLKSIGIKVLYFPGFCTEEVANHACAFILSAYRRLPQIMTYQKHLSIETWGKPLLMDGVKKSSLTTVGLLGFGRIGRAVSNRLRTCGFKIIAYDPYVEDIVFKNYDVTKVNFQELRLKSHILSIHCSLSEETRNMVDADFFEQSKDSLILINTARGAIVNSNDLKLFLDKGKIKMAYVDVYNPEPCDKFSLCHSSLYVTPHIAFYSEDSLDCLKRNFIQQSVRAYYGMQCDTDCWA